MKTIGVYQLGQKTYDILSLNDKFKPCFGSIPRNVEITFAGGSGHGKTEGVMQFVKHLCEIGLSIDWISYEQGHGFDLQQAVIRNNMIDVAKNFQITDPHADKDPNTTYFQDFENKVKKRGSPDIYVIDSTQYSHFTEADYLYLKRKYGHKKGFIWISHIEGRKLRGTLANTIAELGGVTVWVKNYIAEPVKNRFGGNEKFVIYEKRARLLEPKYFAELDKQA